MGYNLYITRKEEWFEEQSNNNISLDEWLSYIQSSNSELELSDVDTVKLQEVEIKPQVGPGFCKWTAHPTNKRPWFLYFEGNIETKYPDELTIKKMISIAQDLNAKVQGDDGETYKLSADNEILSNSTEVWNIVAPGKKVKKPWWKFW